MEQKTPLPTPPPGPEESTRSSKSCPVLGYRKLSGALRVSLLRWLTDRARRNDDPERLHLSLNERLRADKIGHRLLVEEDYRDRLEHPEPVVDRAPVPDLAPLRRALASVLDALDETGR